MSKEDIENNNGWIKIESKDDLPKDYNEYSFVYSFEEGFINTLNNAIVRNVSLHELFSDSEITHYQPIIKPKPPVY